MYSPPALPPCPTLIYPLSTLVKCAMFACLFTNCRTPSFISLLDDSSSTNAALPASPSTVCPRSAQTSSSSPPPAPLRSTSILHTMEPKHWTMYIKQPRMETITVSQVDGRHTQGVGDDRHCRYTPGDMSSSYESVSDPSHPPPLRSVSHNGNFLTCSGHSDPRPELNAFVSKTSTPPPLQTLQSSLQMSSTHGLSRRQTPCPHHNTSPL